MKDTRRTSKIKTGVKGKEWREQRYGVPPAPRPRAMFVPPLTDYCKYSSFCCYSFNVYGFVPNEYVN